MRRRHAGLRTGTGTGAHQGDQLGRDADGGGVGVIVRRQRRLGRCCRDRSGLRRPGAREQLIADRLWQNGRRQFVVFGWVDARGTLGGVAGHHRTTTPTGAASGLGCPRRGLVGEAAGNEGADVDGAGIDPRDRVDGSDDLGAALEPLVQAAAQHLEGEGLDSRRDVWPHRAREGDLLL